MKTDSWPSGVDPARWLRGATSSGDPLASAIAAVLDELDQQRIRAELAEQELDAYRTAERKLAAMLEDKRRAS